MEHNKRMHIDLAKATVFARRVMRTFGRMKGDQRDTGND